MSRLTVLSAIIGQIKEDIDNGNCEINDEQLDEFIEMAVKLKGDNEWLSKEESCAFLGVSKSTFERRVADGFIQPGTRRFGFRELMWRKRDLTRE